MYCCRIHLEALVFCNYMRCNEERGSSGFLRKYLVRPTGEAVNGRWGSSVHVKKKKKHPTNYGYTSYIWENMYDLCGIRWLLGYLCVCIHTYCIFSFKPLLCGFPILFSSAEEFLSSLVAREGNQQALVGCDYCKWHVFSERSPEYAKALI